MEVYGYVIIGFAVVFVLFVMFYASRYKKFVSSQYMIHFRGGKVIKAGIGGKAVVLPLIDEVRVIPVTTQSTFLEAKEKVVSREFQEISVSAFVFWRVIDPEVAFSRTSWDVKSSAHVETIIKNAAESIIRTTCANMPLEKIIRDRQAIIEAVTKELHTLTKDWGLLIESCEIREIEIIDP
ncbi:MAG: SPFH domain-containing protein, partial [Candidatus Heimdallarchaeota archaeon]|nr:SPFH domain-containing protein [Candidatus Heimdallarchaeota archaeon]